MKIKKIEINNYKAFYKKYEIPVDGKNLFIYGENGSGKSSFYYALKDFFQSSKEDIDFDEVENLFLTTREKGKGYVKVTFNPDYSGAGADKMYTLASGTKDTVPTAIDTSIRDAISLKSFLTYKHLLGIHNIKKDGEIDLFDLLVNGVLKHFKSIAITGGSELGGLWESVKAAGAKDLNGRLYTVADRRRDIETSATAFNSAFDKLFDGNSPEYIVNYAQPILDTFGHNIKIVLTSEKPNRVELAGVDFLDKFHVRISLNYLGKQIDKPHLFLNEARLSAIAISIYLGMIKRHIQGIPCKVLFLDDIFIGLDIANRLPLMEILKRDFSQYQIFITTYDKPWYEFMKFYLDGDVNWKATEFYSRRARKGFEIPVVKPKDGNSFIQDFINTAQNYYNSADNKAAGVYLRSAFEFILKRYCEKRSISVKYVTDPSKLNSDDFWQAVKKFRQENLARVGAGWLTAATETAVEHSRKLVLNPLSHHDINKHEISAEILLAIATITTLKTELGM